MLSRKLCTLMILAIVLWGREGITATSAKGICEVLLMKVSWREAVEAAFQRDVKSRPFTLVKVNPNIIPGTLPDEIFSELHPRGIGLSVLHEEKPKAIVLRLETPREVFEYRIPPIYPISLWVETRYSFGEMSRVIDQVGKGLIGAQPLLKNFEKYLQRGKLFFGFVLSEYDDGGRSYLSLGYSRRGNLQLAFGMDVPCEDIEGYVLLPKGPAIYSEWEVGQLLTEFGRYCRIPVALFY